MTSLKGTLASSVSVLLLIGSAEAAITTTTPFVRAATGETVECGVVNAGPTTRTVRIQIIRAFDGLVLEDTTTSVGVVAGTGFGISVGDPIDEVYCRFLASASTLHGSLKVHGTATGVDRLVLPAR